MNTNTLSIHKSGVFMSTGIYLSVINLYTSCEPDFHSLYYAKVDSHFFELPDQELHDFDERIR